MQGHDHTPQGIPLVVHRLVVSLPIPLAMIKFLKCRHYFSKFVVFTTFHSTSWRHVDRFGPIVSCHAASECWVAMQLSVSWNVLEVEIFRALERNWVWMVSKDSSFPSKPYSFVSACTCVLICLPLHAASSRLSMLPYLVILLFPLCCHHQRSHIIPLRQWHSGVHSPCVH